MNIPTVRMAVTLGALLAAAPSLQIPTQAAQNPITAARDAFRKVQEEAKRKAQEEAKRRAQEEAEKRLPGGQPSAGQPAAASGQASGAPTGPTSVVQSGAAPRATGTAETT